MDARDIARDCLRRGINPVPVAHWGKQPILADWQNRQITPDNVDSIFGGRLLNVGAQLGARSGGLIDVDLDCPEAVTAGNYLLPKTRCIFGRESSRGSHRFYRSPLYKIIDKAWIRFADPAPRARPTDSPADHGALLLELRLGGGDAGAQTVFPGSVHGTGEMYQFEPECDGEPAVVEKEVLLRAVKRTAAATLFARHWPGNGQRHAARLAVPGLLARADMTEIEACLFMEAVIRAGNDPDPVDVKAAVMSTFKLAANNGVISGIAAARDVFGIDVANRAAEWLGCRTAPAPPAGLSANDDLTRLVGLSPVEYEQVRKAEAKKLGVRVGALDARVEELRSGLSQGSGAGRALRLTTPEPWPEHVNGAELLDRLEQAISKHVMCTRAASIAVPLWTLHAHAVNAFTFSPRLAITSPEKRCGKSTLLRLIERLTPKALQAANITAAAVFRTVEIARPTLLIDEADTFLTENEELRGIINSGHEISGNVVRLVGEDHEPRSFSTYCPTAIAAIGKIPGTIEDRSVSIALRRRKKGEAVERFRSDRTAHLDELNRMAARWAADNIPALAELDPEVPEQLHDRAADNWRPLLAIAEQAGCEWPAKARSAALELTVDADADADDHDAAQTMLLADIRDIFAGKSEDRIASEELALALSAMRERPWPGWHSGRQISPAAIARLLKPYGIRPQTVRFTNVTAKGYYRADFEDAFARYLSDFAVTGSQLNISQAIREFPSVTRESL